MNELELGEALPWTLYLACCVALCKLLCNSIVQDKWGGGIAEYLFCDTVLEKWPQQHAPLSPHTCASSPTVNRGCLPGPVEHGRQDFVQLLASRPREALPRLFCCLGTRPWHTL